MQTYVDTYKQRGVVVIPCLTPEELKLYIAHYQAAMATFPEYRHPVEMYVMGGFGAFGNPASFHHPAVRHLRHRLMLTAIPFFTALAPDMNLEQLFDRTSLRRQGTSPTAELWHRDVSPTTDPVFGGWINLDVSPDSNQYFSCVPGTHPHSTERVNTPAGFKKFSPAEVTEFKRRRELITVPPGHWIVFNQQLVHEVVAKKATHDSLRQYVGFRLTSSPQPLFDHTATFDSQGVPLLPSGQVPPMYAANHASFFGSKLDAWSETTFQPVCLTNKGRVHRHMQSLAAYNLPLYPPYSETERAIMTPQRYRR